MARTLVAKTTLLGAYGTYTAGAADVVLAGADLANKNYVVLEEGDIVIAYNTNVGAQTVTIDSVANEQGRTGDITAYSLAAGDIAVFGPFRFEGWRNATTGFLDLEASHAEVLLGVISGAAP